MRRLVGTTIIALCYFHSLMASGTAFNFSESNFDAARSRATAEGKMLLVDFYANWCAPCKWMEEKTFSDPHVISSMNESYITVKVNIDDFDGYALKEHYEVRVLPTLIIFNNDGKIIERVEETLSPAKMRSLLDKNRKYKKDRIHSANIAPSASTYGAAASPETPSANVNGLRYSLQLGVFSNYKSTLAFHKKIKSRMTEPMIIIHDYKGTSIIYRVLMGEFNNTTDAEIYKTKLKTDYGIESTLYF